MISELGLSQRAYNALTRARMTSIIDIVNIGEAENLKRIRNVGKGSFEEILEVLESKGISIDEEGKFRKEGYIAKAPEENLIKINQNIKIKNYQAKQMKERIELYEKAYENFMKPENSIFKAVPKREVSEERQMLEEKILVDQDSKQSLQEECEVMDKEMDEVKGQRSVSVAERSGKERE